MRAIDDISLLDHSQKVMLVGARDDTRPTGQDCGAMAKQLAGAARGQAELIVYEQGGHGTDMWQKHPELILNAVKFFTVTAATFPVAPQINC